MFIRAVDIGGNGIRRVDIDEAGTVSPVVEIDRPIASLDEALDFACQAFLPQTVGIAYSVPGVILQHNFIERSPNVHLLDGFRLATATTDKTKICSGVFNDMEASVAGMATLFPDTPYFLGVTWSSDIGMKVWSNGKILSTAEGGHVLIDPSPFAPLCGCGHIGHAEAIIGGDAIRRRIIVELQAQNRKIPDDMDPCAFLDTLYKSSSDSWAARFYSMVACGMGIMLANIQCLLCLPCIIWKGTFAVKALKMIEYDIRANMKKHLIASHWADDEFLKFEICDCNDFDAFIGAARLLKDLTR